jgi:uncharacterized protein (UPF0262 family)
MIHHRPAASPVSIASDAAAEFTVRVQGIHLADFWQQELSAAIDSLRHSPGLGYNLVLGMAENAVSIASQNWQTTIAIDRLRPFTQPYFHFIRLWLESAPLGNAGHLDLLDAGRRGLHNDGAEMLQQLWPDKNNLDFDCARLIFFIIALMLEAEQAPIPQ